ncbi:MAG: hypothetical protein AB8G05_26380 [Oligoflexales bacterium]
MKEVDASGDGDAKESGGEKSDKRVEKPAPKKAEVHIKNTSKPNTDAKNRVQHEKHKQELEALPENQHFEYKKEIRKNMEKPVVEDMDLQDKINEHYRPDAEIGNGSTADAVRYERKNGPFLKKKNFEDIVHTEKAKNDIKFFEKWLDKNPNANRADHEAARQMILDLKESLGWL